MACLHVILWGSRTGLLACLGMMVFGLSEVCGLLLSTAWLLVGKQGQGGLQVVMSCFSMTESCLGAHGVGLCQPRIRVGCATLMLHMPHMRHMPAILAWLRSDAVLLIVSHMWWQSNLQIGAQEVQLQQLAPCWLQHFQPWKGVRVSGVGVGEAEGVHRCQQRWALLHMAVWRAAPSTCSCCCSVGCMGCRAYQHAATKRNIVGRNP